MTLPLVSILMPVYQEERFVSQSLQAVLSQDYPKELIEILVVDGMSTDETREIVKSFQKQHPHLKLLDNPRKIVAPGLNQGIHEAKGQIIIRVDGHCVIEKDYVSQCVRLLQERQIDAVGGPIETISKTFMARAIAIAMSSFFGVGGSAFRTLKNIEKEVDTVAFPAYRKEVFNKVGSFDEELVRNQDDEFNYRLRKAGGKILLSPQIRSAYYSRSNLKSLWSQYFQYGYWKVRVLQKHPKQMQWRQFVPPVFVALSLLPPVIQSYLAVNLIISAWLASKKGWKYFPLLPIVFAALHFAYGLGFLWGLVGFANRWKK